MRFREYESTSTASSSPRVEYVLSNGAGVDGTNNLVWSISKTKRAIDEAVKSPTGGTHEAGGVSILKSLKLQIIDTINSLKKLSQDLFLPIDYPSSVADGYIEYQFYDSLQGLCSYLRGVVSTSAVLSATGVGDAEATAMSAAMVGRQYGRYVYIFLCLR